MPDDAIHAVSELVKSEEGLKTLSSIAGEHYNLARSFVSPFFEKFAEYRDLYEGGIPDLLRTTFSQLVLNLAYGYVETELPRLVSSVFSREDFFRLRAATPEMEADVELAQLWLQHVMNFENRIFLSIIPTFQAMCVYGTAYRGVTHYFDRGYQYDEALDRIVRTGTVVKVKTYPIDVFQVLPSPNASWPNPSDPCDVNAADYVFMVDYPTARRLRAIGRYETANPDAIEEAIARESRGDYFESQYADSEKKDSMFLSGKRVLTDRQKRLRCLWYFTRDFWALFDSDFNLLYYAEPAPIDWIPIARYIDMPDFNSWFGKGIIEVVYDLIVAFMLNFNKRIDYLFQTMHPSKWVRQDIARINPDKDFDPEPWSRYVFPATVRDIRNAVFYDRPPEMTPQAFLEENAMRALLQEILGQPNYMKGMGGVGTLSNESATGIMALIEEGTARSVLRSVIAEYSGLHDELMLVLKYGANFVWDNPFVRKRGEEWPWRLVPADAIDDSYIIELMGTREIMAQNEKLKRLISLAGLLLGNPNVPNQRAVIEAIVREAGIFRDPDELFALPAEARHGSPRIPAASPEEVGPPTPYAPGVSPPSTEQEVRATEGATPTTSRRARATGPVSVTIR